MWNRDLGRFKETLKRAIHRKMFWLIFFEAIAGLWLYFDGQLDIGDWWQWLWFVFAFGSLILLARWEYRQDIPLPFLNHLRAKEFSKTFVCAFVLSFLIPIIPILGRVLLALAQEATAITVTSVIFNNLASGANAGIAEESDKVVLTNLVTMFFCRKVLGKRRSEKMENAILYVVGSASVALWSWGHVAFMHYFIITALMVATSIFSVGMFYFWVIVSKKNYLPIVLAHMSYDFVLFMRPLLFYYLVHFSPMV